jgi:putative sterol carrier protein
MASYTELQEAINDYIEQAHKSARVLKSLRNWQCTIYIEASDLKQGFTMRIKDASVSVQEGTSEAPDLIVRGTSEDLVDIFWCDANPASTYMQGAVKIQGASENVMRLDAMSLLIYLELNKA